MKKQFLRSVLMAVFGVGLSAGGALALPTPPVDYNWTTADYFSLTDYTTSNSDVVTIGINAGFGADFGFYTVDNVANPTSITQRLKIVDKTDSVGQYRVVTFHNTGSGWEAKVGANGAYQAFGTTFGFYYNIYTDGINDPTVDYTWYTDKKFNAPGDTAFEHVLVAYNDTDKVAYTYLDDQLHQFADQDFNDKTIRISDVQAVPEPATMLLFGVGVAGLAGVARRRKEALA